jgi:hypothetical protein
VTFQEKEYEFQLWCEKPCIWKTTRVYSILDEVVAKLEDSKMRCRIIEVNRKVHIVSKEGEPE